VIPSYSKLAWRLAEEGQKALLELVLPAVCRLCNAPVAVDHDFCTSCETALSNSEPMLRNHCSSCGMPRPHGKISSDENRNETAAKVLTTQLDPVLSNCPHCRNLTFEFDRVAALWAYQNRVCDAIVAAKYVRQTALGDALGRRLARLVVDCFANDLPDAVTYVPSHMRRRVSRGGTGTSVMAEAVARSINRPCRALLRTTRAIEKQAWLDDQGRLENVAGAFTVKKRYALPRSPEPPNRHILVVDDVLTTGATANEVARVLKIGGAARVSLAVVARAIRS
jgi:predicted amidophosphoribosyltransferase